MAFRASQAKPGQSALDYVVLFSGIALMLAVVMVLAQDPTSFG